MNIERRSLNYLNATGFKLGLLVNFGHYPEAGMGANREHCQAEQADREKSLFESF